jgi:hypothetical protein
MRGGAQRSPDCKASHLVHSGHHDPSTFAVAFSHSSGPRKGGFGRFHPDLIEMPLLARPCHDARIVTTAGQKVGNVGFHLIVYLVGGFPGRHVIANRPDHEHRRVDIRQRNRLSLHQVAALGQIIVE